jgi:hypothetical protein
LFGDNYLALGNRIRLVIRIIQASNESQPKGPRDSTTCRSTIRVSNRRVMLLSFSPGGFRVSETAIMSIIQPTRLYHLKKSSYDLPQRQDGTYDRYDDSRRMPYQPTSLTLTHLTTYLSHFSASQRIGNLHTQTLLHPMQL